MNDRLLDAFHRSGLARFQLESGPDQRLNRLRHHHRPGLREARNSGGQVGAKAVYVVLVGVQVHQPAVHPYPDRDLDPEQALGLLVEAGHLPRDRQARQHGALDVVLMGYRMAENRKQPITFRGSDMSLISVHDREHLFAVPADQPPIHFRLHPRGQHRRIHEIGEQHRQAANLATVDRASQHVFGFGIVLVDGQNAACQGGRCSAVATVDRGCGAIE